MKRYFKMSLVVLLLFLNININVKATRSSNRSLDIYINNFNQSIDEYYVDILVKGESCSVESSEEKIKIVQGYHEDGFIGAVSCLDNIKKTVVTSERHRDLHRFEGNLPSEFKVIIVDRNNEVIVSELVNTEAYNSIIYFNVTKNEIKIQNLFFNVMALFAFSFILIIIIKVIIMYLLKIDFNQNLKTFLTINIIGVGLMSIIVSMSTYIDGYLFAYKTLFVLGAILLVLESLIFTFAVKTSSLKRRLSYGVLANIFGMLIFALCLLFTII